MYARTLKGDSCSFKANFHCLHNKNTDPNRSCSGDGYFSKCRYSYCPLTKGDMFKGEHGYKRAMYL